MGDMHQSVHRPLLTRIAMKRFSLWALLFSFLSFPMMAESEETEEVVPSKVNLGVSFGTVNSDLKALNLPQLMLRDGYAPFAEYWTWHVDVSSEFFFCKERFSLATGVRFTSRYAAVDNGWDEMYWMVKETPTTCDYITLGSLGQRNLYMGVPLAMRVFFAPYQCRVRPYVKVDASFDFRIATNNYVDILNERMERLFERPIMDQLGKPDVFHASLGASGGVRIRCNNFYVNPEIIFPLFELGNAPIHFVEKGDMGCGAGLKVSFQFPIGHSAEEVVEVESTYDTAVQSEKDMPSEDF